MEQHDFIKGALIGCCLGGLAALFLAPKSGSELINDITEGYHSLSDSSRKQYENVKKRTSNIVDTLQEKYAGEHHNIFLIGGIAGTIIGAIAALFLAPQSGHKLREKLGDQYCEICDKAKDTFHKHGKNFHQDIEEWKDLFSNLFSRLSSQTSKYKGEATSYLNNLMDWAYLGLRLYKDIQHRR